jgi:L-ribulokinase
MVRSTSPISLGLDFGTESVRAVLVDADGTICGSAQHAYRHGQILGRLPNSEITLPANYAFQDPNDWLDSVAIATNMALVESSVEPHRIVGIGVDFTSCTMLPTLLNGTPLCSLERLSRVPMAWPKLWKHHGAMEQTEKMNRIARFRNESFLSRYGGVIGLEWFFPKLLETIEVAPDIAEAAEVWIEAGDWLVWKLVGGPAAQLPRSTCQAGYKALWSSDEGYANSDYLTAVDPRLAEAAARKLPGRMLSPGQLAGKLCPEMAIRLGLPAGIAVSAAIIDAHAAVPGVGEAEPGVLVMVMGTSSCHMLNSSVKRPIDGVAGIVDGGILPGLFGYETGQAAVGDAFAWLINLLNQDGFKEISERAGQLPPGAEGVVCLDWMNGCRTPLMDGGLKGAFTGLTLGTTPAHLYRALLEGSAFGLRWIVELLREGGVPVERFVATGGLPHHNPEMVGIYANVLAADIEVHPSQHGCAVGAAVLGMIAAGPEVTGLPSVAVAARAMARPQVGHQKSVRHDPSTANIYAQLYSKYRRLAESVRSL